MRFDDRLATVLAQPGESARERAIRWRQLVDLVARSGERADPTMLSDAMAAIRADHEAVAEDVRAATARAIAGRPLPLPLLQLFIGDVMAVAAPLLASLPSDPATLAALRAAASDQVRPVLDSLGAKPPPPSAPPPEPSPPEPAEPKPQPPVPSLGDVVARIERLRSSRERPPPAAPGDATPAAGASPSLFRWECDPSGDIDWVDGAPRGALVGRSIATADAEDGVDERVERAFGVRAAFRDCRLEIGEDGLLAGQWMISGVPAFSPADGRFIGYRGIARREEVEEPLAAAGGGESGVDHDWLREMMHEIKTPLNAIIGFAEIIDGQYFGPAHSRYRERAAEIVANARSLLEAAEDLDFAARLQSARARPGEGTGLADFFTRFAEDLQANAARLGVMLDLDLAGAGEGRLALDPELTERLLRRFSDAVLGAAGPGEALKLAVRSVRGRCEVAMTRPRATLHAGKDELLDPEFTIGEGAALLGLGFSLRLVNGLVGIAGGTLDVSERDFSLSLPLARR